MLKDNERNLQFCQAFLESRGLFEAFKQTFKTATVDRTHGEEDVYELDGTACAFCSSCASTKFVQVPALKNCSLRLLAEKQWIRFDHADKRSASSG